MRKSKFGGMQRVIRRNVTAGTRQGSLSPLDAPALAQRGDGSPHPLSLLHTVRAASGWITFGRPWPRRTMDFGWPGVAWILPEKASLSLSWPTEGTIYAR
jgi:hypothetical protein